MAVFRSGRDEVTRWCGVEHKGSGWLRSSALADSNLSISGRLRTAGG